MSTIFLNFNKQKNIILPRNNFFMSGKNFFHSYKYYNIKNLSNQLFLSRMNILYQKYYIWQYKYLSYWNFIKILQPGGSLLNEPSNWKWGHKSFPVWISQL